MISNNETYAIMRILYLHGLGDRPGGTLPQFLESCEWEVIEPDLPDLDFDECLRVAQRAFDESQPDALIGYSQGGAAAMNIETGDTPQILISPGWKFRAEATTVKPQTIIVNPHDDALVPLQDVRELLEVSGLTEEGHLVVAGKWHGAFDEKTLEVIRGVVVRAVDNGS